MSHTRKILALSGGKDSLACLHLLRAELEAAIYVDTGHAYPDTHAMIDYAKTLLPVHVVSVDLEAQQARAGYPSDVVPVYWTVDGEQLSTPKPYRVQPSFLCCYANLAQPLFAEARRLQATHLVFGQRRDETYRATTCDGALVDGLIRVHPIEDWTTAQVLAYLETQMSVPPYFYTIGHSSLDCYDCTGYHHDSQDRRAWMQVRYPAYYAAYETKRRAVHDAIQTAL